jgi:hypothetical protein
MQKISRAAAVQMIQESNGKIMNVLFRKRSDNSLREMICRTGVTKHLKGVGPSYSFEAKKLVSVYDMQAGKEEIGKGYRSIPVEGIKQITIDGEVYKVE